MDTDAERPGIRVLSALAHSAPQLSNLELGRASQVTRRYDPDRLRDFYDVYGEREWWRLTTRPSDEVNFFVHCHYLQRFVQRGHRVLEIGAGPGRFTIELARLGARITVGDLSSVQLELNSEFVRRAGCEGAVEARLQLDACDLSRFDAASFDVVVCYGGVLSYLFEQAQTATQELVRVLRPGGHCLVSVMSRLYNIRKRDVLSRVVPVMREGGLEALEQLFGSGHYTGGFAQGHEMRLFSGDEIASLLSTGGLHVITTASSNCLSAGNDQEVESFRTDGVLWSRFLEWELREGTREGALDAGHHIIAVGAKENAP